jgi:cold shock protein
MHATVALTEDTNDTCSATAVERAGLSSLNQEQVIEYEIIENRGKQSAENLQVSR